jgi:hypothetical protein
LLLANVVLALTLHPLLIYIIKPRFIKKGVSTGAEAIQERAV